MDKQYSSRTKKRFGQHWLQSDRVLDQIANAAELNSSDRILEIGPGTGVLTRRLLGSVDSVLAVEIDKYLCKKLTKKFQEYQNFLLLQGDFLALDIPELVKPFPLFQKQTKIVANIPYNITGLILEKLLGSISQPNTKDYESIVLLIQKEVGDRLTANPSTKEYGALSVRIQYLASCEKICDVPAKAFYPPPKVDSVVVRLRPHTLSNPAENVRQLETLVKLGFSSRRKMLRNNLKSVIEVDDLNNLLEKLDINPQSRAEDLSLENWISLSNSFPCAEVISNK
ncbi:dimethyladenosine transferase [Xenococcus sp. PCC 7305]|uniref:16S rRNA (adenine(1518)-N(6)/adenine(1519)-N(6))- dimethyltransferase RsmA n=1 Tax=Xenococcus sp. PCC 7305 TaxID=102125 RepID=UPI0002AC34CB|nr:16S rRNA (adenine(1518)-N(6)/adenine(1519)-N(6))-dimethyltransferase RsmA [Xenococcus sp. PCC 7305]ELS01263.1 dimethyladenosine transferase [Xenococcus sp. PCC 7305]